MKHKLTEKKGLVSIWLNVWFDNSNDLIGRYDHDYIEGCSLDETKDLQIEIQSMSYGKSYGKSAATVAKTFNINNAEYIWMIFDYVCSANPGFLTSDETVLKGVNAMDKPVFLGNFEYKK